jgi:predicted neutral ceramidase superfamily lipid hydrolase
VFLALLFNVLCLNLKIKNMIVLPVFSLVIWNIFTLCLTLKSFQERQVLISMSHDNLLTNQMGLSK